MLVQIAEDDAGEEPVRDVQTGLRNDELSPIATSIKNKKNKDARIT
jgi:hypothetical protein